MNHTLKFPRKDLKDQAKLELTSLLGGLNVVTESDTSFTITVQAAGHVVTKAIQLVEDKYKSQTSYGVNESMKTTDIINNSLKQIDEGIRLSKTGADGQARFNQWIEGFDKRVKPYLGKFLREAYPKVGGVQYTIAIYQKGALATADKPGTKFAEITHFGRNDFDKQIGRWKLDHTNNLVNNKGNILYPLPAEVRSSKQLLKHIIASPEVPEVTDGSAEVSNLPDTSITNIPKRLPTEVEQKYGMDTGVLSEVQAVLGGEITGDILKLSNGYQVMKFGPADYSVVGEYGVDGKYRNSADIIDHLRPKLTPAPVSDKEWTQVGGELVYTGNESSIPVKINYNRHGDAQLVMGDRTLHLDAVDDLPNKFGMPHPGDELTSYLAKSKPAAPGSKPENPKSGNWELNSDGTLTHFSGSASSLVNIQFGSTGMVSGATIDNRHYNDLNEIGQRLRSKGLTPPDDLFKLASSRAKSRDTDEPEGTYSAANPKIVIDRQKQELVDDFNAEELDDGTFALPGGYTIYFDGQWNLSDGEVEIENEVFAKVMNEYIEWMEADKQELGGTTSSKIQAALDALKPTGADTLKVPADLGGQKVTIAGVRGTMAVLDNGMSVPIDRLKMEDGSKASIQKINAYETTTSAYITEDVLASISDRVSASTRTEIARQLDEHFIVHQDGTLSAKSDIAKQLESQSSKTLKLAQSWGEYIIEYHSVHSRVGDRIKFFGISGVRDGIIGALRKIGEEAGEKVAVKAIYDKYSTSDKSLTTRADTELYWEVDGTKYSLQDGMFLNQSSNTMIDDDVDYTDYMSKYESTITTAVPTSGVDTNSDSIEYSDIIRGEGSFYKFLESKGYRRSRGANGDTWYDSQGNSLPFEFFRELDMVGVYQGDKSEDYNIKREVAFRRSNTYTVAKFLDKFLGITASSQISSIDPKITNFVSNMEKKVNRDQYYDETHINTIYGEQIGRVSFHPESQDYGDKWEYVIFTEYQSKYGYSTGSGLTTSQIENVLSDIDKISPIKNFKDGTR